MKGKSLCVRKVIFIGKLIHHLMGNRTHSNNMLMCLFKLNWYMFVKNGIGRTINSVATPRNYILLILVKKNL